MESPANAQRVDVLVGGAGFAGLALAIALRQGLGPSFSVTVADPAFARAASDGRASAIVAAARRLFETIGVWEQIEAQPILEMVVTDSRTQDTVAGIVEFGYTLDKFTPYGRYEFARFPSERDVFWAATTQQDRGDYDAVSAGVKFVANENFAFKLELELNTSDADTEYRAAAQIAFGF